jgi:transposase
MDSPKPRRQKRHGGILLELTNDSKDEPMKQLTATKSATSKSPVTLAACTAIGVDLAKRVFQVAGQDAQGQVIFEDRIRSREAFTTFLRTLPAGVTVLMETGPGAQSWARLLVEQGHTARILPAQRVAEHRSGAKNDRKDAHAILRAGRDSDIHAVPVKSAQALAMQALHRARQGYVSRRTALSNQMRGLLLEHGIAMAKGDAPLVQGVSRVIADEGCAVPAMLRELIGELLAEWRQQSERLEAMAGKLAAIARQDPKARQLMTVRGIGPVIATAVIAKECQPERFASGRNFAAYFGVVPDERSTGEKKRLGKMSRRGDVYLRSMMVEGAQAVLAHVKADSQHSDDRRLVRWLDRHGRKGAAIRLANRNFRIVWAMLQNDENYRRESARGQECAEPVDVQEVQVH